MLNRENHNTFDHSLYQEHHHQDDLINPFKNFPVEHTPVNFLLFTDSPQWGTTTSQDNSQYILTANRDKGAKVIAKSLLGQWKNGDFDHMHHSSSKYMGAYKLAHEIRQHGFTVQVVDYHTHLDRKTLKRIIDKFVGEETLLIGVSNTFRLFRALGIRASVCNFDPFEDFNNEEVIEWFSSNNYSRFFSLGGPADRDLKSYIHNINPDIKFIIGGAYTNPQQSVTKDEELIDYINLGYGDLTVPELLQQLKEKNTDAINYPKNNNDVLTLMDAKSRLDIQHSTMEWQPEDIVLDGEILPLEVSRGCIFKCRFCSFALNGKEKGEALRGIDRIEEELVENYEKYGVTNYWLTDDTFNDDHDKLVAWYEMSQRLPFKLKWSSYIRWDLVYANRNQEIPQAKLIADSGGTFLNLGIETTNPESAKDVSKGLDPMLQFEFMNEMKQTYLKDVHLMSGFIAGLPSDTKQSLRTMSTFLTSNNNPLVTTNMNPLFIRNIGDDATYFTEQSESEFSKTWRDWGYEETTVDMNGQPIPQAFLDVWKSVVIWKNRNGLTFYDTFKYALRFHERLHALKKQKTGGLFFAHGLPFKDPRLFSSPTDYDESNNNIYNFKEYAKINQYFYKLFTFNQSHSKK